MANIAEIDVHSEPGYIIIQRASGPPVRYPLTDLIRVADVPTGLTYTQVASISALANLFSILIRTLIDRGILDETFGESDDDLSLDLEHIIKAIEDMGGTYHEPDLDDAGV